MLLAGIVLWLAGAGHAYAQLAVLKRLDPDGDGKVVRDKLPSIYKRMLDRIIDRYGLDKKKGEWKIEELRAAITSGAKKRLAAEQAGQPAGRPAAPAAGSPAGKLATVPPHKPGELHPLVQLPAEYASYDKDHDGQIGLYEWPRKRIPEFLKLDKNDGGFLTIEELGKPQGEKGEKKGSGEAKGSSEQKGPPAKPGSKPAA